MADWDEAVDKLYDLWWNVPLPPALRAVVDAGEELKLLVEVKYDE